MQASKEVHGSQHTGNGNEVIDMTKQKFSETYPNISQRVDQDDTVEIGYEENTDSLVRSLDKGGLVW